MSVIHTTFRLAWTWKQLEKQVSHAVIKDALLQLQPLVSSRNRHGYQSELSMSNLSASSSYKQEMDLVADHLLRQRACLSVRLTAVRGLQRMAWQQRMTRMTLTCRLQRCMLSQPALPRLLNRQPRWPVLSGRLSCVSAQDWKKTLLVSLPVHFAALGLHSMCGNCTVDCAHIMHVLLAHDCCLQSMLTGQDLARQETHGILLGCSQMR